MKTIYKSLLIASLAVIVIVGSAGAADVSYGEDEQYTNATQGTSVVVDQDPGGPVGEIRPIPEFSTIAIPVAAILGLMFLFNYRKRRREN
ncbi:MAG: PEF-CTERM sorting domain-containing protein [Euryarchaeota archaeon]|nr:PEF-CTERM sorting domain-containing protein [Euryarchaeota archaeon]